MISLIVVTLTIVLICLSCSYNVSMETIETNVAKRYQHLHRHHEMHHFNTSWDCKRAWPELALFVPVEVHENEKHPKYHELETIFLRSFQLFWPTIISNTSLYLVYDEGRENTIFMKNLSATVNKLTVPGGIHIVPCEQSPFVQGGYNKQQWIMFWADNFTSAEYVGFSDTDTAFVTYVDREDLFENGKPVVNGQSGYAPQPPYSDWTRGDWMATGLLEPLKCMTYFPVIVKTAHLKLMRDYIGRHHNMTFNEAFRDKIQRGPYSQFGVMCTYLWTFHRDEYTWYVNSVTPDWDGIKPPPILGQDGNLSQFTTSMWEPKPRIAVHGRHRDRPQLDIVGAANRDEFNHLLALGYCYSPPFPHNDSFCVNVDPKKYHKEMHNFEQAHFDHFNSPDRLNWHAALRHHRLRNCSVKWAPDLLDSIGISVSNVTRY